MTQFGSISHSGLSLSLLVDSPKLHPIGYALSIIYIWPINSLQWKYRRLNAYKDLLYFLTLNVPDQVTSGDENEIVFRTSVLMFQRPLKSICDVMM